ncbi:MAG: hypothetical protein ACXWQQ_11685 [Pseudobdellovibrio sp.]
MLLTCKLTSIFITVLAPFLFGINVYAEAASDGFKLNTDFYAAHTDILPYKGYQDDISATFSLPYRNSKLVPIARALWSSYNYQVPPSTDHLNDQRTALGLGLDYKLTDYLWLRVLFENVHNKDAGDTYNQDSYGVIYNQYLDFHWFELNNYLEAFYIPRFSRETADTFLRVQALKSFDITRSSTTSNVVYPFVDFKAKFNDDEIFGVTGQNASVGAGYKFYNTNKLQTDSFAVVFEGHSIFYQSKNFNGDWFQAMVVLQWTIN